MQPARVSIEINKKKKYFLFAEKNPKWRNSFNGNKKGKNCDVSNGLKGAI